MHDGNSQPEREWQMSMEDNTTQALDPDDDLLPLPPLPGNRYTLVWHLENEIEPFECSQFFTSEQMWAYAIKAITEDRERCIEKIADCISVQMIVAKDLPNAYGVRFKDGQHFFAIGPDQDDEELMNWFRNQFIKAISNVIRNPLAK